jgi:hypothetical protein
MIFTGHSLEVHGIDEQNVSKPGQVMNKRKATGAAVDELNLIP